MKLKQLNRDFSVCQLSSTDQLDFTQDFLFFSKTDDEFSLVCETKYIPSNAVKVESDWKALKIQGILDFGLIGIIAQISSILAENKISLFVVSTYNTDYILIKAACYDQAVLLLKEKQYIVY